MSYEDYTAACNQAAAELSAEKRQAFMDRLFGGASLGESQQAEGISFEAALGIMNSQIKRGLYLQREVAA